MKPITVQFQHERETKRTHVYTELDGNGQKVERQDGVVGSLYVKKITTGPTPPQRLTVTIAEP